MYKRTTFYLILVIVILFVILYILNFMRHQDSRSSSNFSDVSTQQKPPPKADLTSLDVHNWHEFASENPPFKVLLPSLPQHASDSQRNSEGQIDREYDMFVSQKENGSVFAITAIKFPALTELQNNENLQEEVLDQLLQAKTSNTLVEKKPHEWNGHKVTDFQIKQNDVLLTGRILAIGQQLYVLTITSESQTFNPREYEFFVNSFDLEEAPTKNEINQH